MSIPVIITQNAEHHSRLVSSLAELAYVPGALKQQKESLTDLSVQLSETERKIEECAKETKKQRKEHEDMRDSVVRKFAYRAAGKKDKFVERANREEREYTEALELEMKERKRKEMLEQKIEEEKQLEVDLLEKNKKYQALSSELDKLYSKVFDTINFPRDNQLKQQYSSAKDVHERLRTDYGAESQALALLRNAERSITHAVDNANKALAASGQPFHAYSSH